MNGPEIYAMVFAIGPGKTDVNVLWAGSDDGLVHVTRDGGKTWTNVTPKEMPEFGRVSQIDASAFDAGTAYVSVRKPLLDDLTPYIFRTHDFGKTLDEDRQRHRSADYVHVVREDRKRKGLLYAGTQHGFYVSFNDGDTWQSLSLNLPDVPVADAWLEDDSIAIATHGRSFYVLDDLAAVAAGAPKRDRATDAYLFQPADAIRGAGGATLVYLLKKPAQKLTLEVLDVPAAVVFTAEGAPPPQRGGPAAAAAATLTRPETRGVAGAAGGAASGVRSRPG